MFKDGTLIIIW